MEEWIFNQNGLRFKDLEFCQASGLGPDPNQGPNIGEAQY